MASYAQEKNLKNALGYIEQMEYKGMFLEVVTYVCILRSCVAIGAADRSKQIYDDIARQGIP